MFREKLESLKNTEAFKRLEELKRSNTIKRIESVVRRFSKRLSEPHAEKSHARVHIYEDEDDYPYFCTWKDTYNFYTFLPDSTIWNVMICVIVVIGLVVGSMGVRNTIFDIAYSIIYFIHASSIAYDMYLMGRMVNVTVFTHFSFILDIASYSYYTGVVKDAWDTHKLTCYFLRLHRPFRFLWSLNDYHLKVSICGTVLKYFYYLIVLRIFWACIWLRFDEVVKYDPSNFNNYTRRNLIMRARKMFFIPLGDDKTKNLTNNTNLQELFVIAIYIINKMHIPIGPSYFPTNTRERVTCLLVMMSGCVIVSGVAIASITSVISVYQSPQETFKARFRLIMKEIHQSHVPPKLRAKVATFYNMYWHKQKGVSSSQLLQSFPPCLPVLVDTDIYFEALQKNRMFRDLSSQFLSEIAKKMQSIHYIPGDVIIKRSSRKSSMIYITYGDIEMLTSEDDNTAILDMTRGTLLSGLSAYIPIACTRAHVQIRASTFCTAQVLNAYDLWRITHKHGTITREGWVMLDAFYEHFDNVRYHYGRRIHGADECKSSIVNFKQNLLLLKQLKDPNGEYILARSDKFLEIAKSYVMRNTTNQFVKEESDEICLRSTFPCILQPESSLIFAWQTFIFLVALFVTIMYPYYLMYHKTIPLSFRLLDYVISIVFATDLIVHLSTGVNVEAGVPITFTQTSTQQMDSFWFVLDVLATLPIFEFIADGYFAGINKLLKLYKIFTYLQNLRKEFVYHSNVLKLTFYTVLTLIACYLIAAIQQQFMCFQFNYCQVTNFTHPPYWVPSQLNDDTVMRRLTFALFWSMSLINFTAHMETFGTDNWNTILYTMIVLETCIVLHIFIESFYSASIMVSSALREGYDACIEQAKNFLIQNEVDPILRQRFTKYLELSWYAEKGYSMTNKRSIFYDLPPHVYQDIVARNRSKYILSIPFMKYLHPELLKGVSSKAVMFYTSPNEILLHTGDISNEIYVVKRGICEVLDPVTKSVVKLVEAKGYFGILESVLRIPAYYTVRAATHVQIFSISRRHLLTAFESTPVIANAIKFTKAQPEYRTLLHRKQRFLGYEPPAQPKNRLYFKLPRKHQKDKLFQEPFNTFGALVILKYIFPRYTIRPDGLYIKRYEWFRAACAFLSAFIVPGYMYLVLQFPNFYYVLALLDLSAYFDILQRFLVGYFDRNGILIWHPAATASHYFKGALIVDLLAALPFESLDKNSAWTQIAPGLSSISHINQYLMFNRLIQLYRLPSVMIVVTEIIERRDVLVVIKSLPYILVFFNVLTCLLVLESVQFSYDESKHYFINVILENDTSWLNIFDKTFRFNLTETAFNVHLGCYFWIVYEGTGTGYNVMNPTSTSQIWLLFIAMFIGGMAGTYMSVKIISIRGNVNKTLAAYQENLKDLSIFMRNENIDKSLHKEMWKFYSYNWDMQSGVDYRNVLKLCDQITLRTDAILHIYGATFAKCPLLAKCDSGFIRILGRAIRSIYFLKNTSIYEVDDVLSDLYFIDYGTVEVRNSNNESIAKLGVGSIFGNLVCDLSSKCSVAARTVTDVHLLCINGGKFWDITSEIPGLRKLLRKYILENKDYIEVVQVLDKQNALLLPYVGTKLWNYIKMIYRSPAPQIYLVIVCFLSIYLELLNAGYQINTYKIIIGMYFFDAAFMLKIVVQILLPVHRITGKKKQKSYFQTDLLLDALSCLPIEVLSLHVSSSDRWHVFSVLRLNRVLRGVTIVKCFRSYHERLGINLILISLSNMFIWLVLFIHANACFFYYIGMTEESVKQKSSWLYKDDGEAWSNDTYVTSVYFIITTFTQYGVGDIMPKTHKEVIFVSYFQIISMMLYMVYVGEFSNLIFFRSYRSFSFFKMYLELLQYMKNNKVSSNLVKVVESYCHHIWRQSRGEQSPYFISTAPHGLKLKIMSAAYMHHLDSNPIFAHCEPAFLRQLVGFLKLYSYTEELFIVKEGEITDAMYFIHSGHILQLKNNARKPPMSLHIGQYFGAMQGLQWDIPYDCSYQARANSLVLTLNLDDWVHLMSHYPKSKATIFKNVSFDDDNPDDIPRETALKAGSSTIWSFNEPKSLRLSRSNSRLMSQAHPGSSNRIDKLHVKRRHESREEDDLDKDVEIGVNDGGYLSSETITKMSTENESTKSSRTLLEQQSSATAATSKHIDAKESDQDIATTSSKYDKALVLRDKPEGQFKIQSLIPLYETKKLDDLKSTHSRITFKIDESATKLQENITKLGSSVKKTSFKLPSTDNKGEVEDENDETSTPTKKSKTNEDITSAKSLIIYKDDKQSSTDISVAKNISSLTITPSQTEHLNINEGKTKTSKSLEPQGSTTEIQLKAQDYDEETNQEALQSKSEDSLGSRSVSSDTNVKLSLKRDKRMSSVAYMKEITDEIESSIGPIRDEMKHSASASEQASPSIESVNRINDKKRLETKLSLEKVRKKRASLAAKRMSMDKFKIRQSMSTETLKRSRLHSTVASEAFRKSRRQSSVSLESLKRSKIHSTVSLDTSRRDTIRNTKSSEYLSKDKIPHRKSSAYLSRGKISRSKSLEYFSRGRIPHTNSAESLNQDKAYLKKSTESLDQDKVHLKKSTESLNQDKVHLKKSTESLDQDKVHLKKSTESLDQVKEHSRKSTESFNKDKNKPSTSGKKRKS